jgi:hypothetical protein
MDGRSEAGDVEKRFHVSVLLFLMVARCGPQFHPARTTHPYLSVVHWLCLATKGRSPNPKA